MAVVAYLRVSTEKQFLENQREEIIRFAEKNGPQKIRNKRLGMVCCFRYSCRHLLAHHLVATGSRCPLRRVHDFVCIPDYRLLPYHAVIRAEKPAQARERVEGKERSISRISSPHEACQKESHL